MVIPKIVKTISLTIVTLGVITGAVGSGFTMWGEVEAVAQIVHSDRCQNARVKIAEYEAVVIQSGKPASSAMLVALAVLQKIVDVSCKKAPAT